MSEKLNWIKSSRSQPQTNDCVELAAGEGGTTHMRDSKDPSGPVLTFNRSEMAAFIGGAQDGEFDHLIG